MKKTILKTAVAATLATVVAMPAQAAVNTFDYTGFFTMLDPTGAALANSSVTGKGANQFQTPIEGTLSFDTLTGAGTGTVVPFQFFGGDSTLPATAVGIQMQTVGDGVGGSGTLVLGNMLFNWNTNNGIPVSIVLDAAGFFNGDLTGGGAGASPASDGTYNSSIPNGGYLGLGPIPIATTAYNTTNAPGCVTGNCMNVAVSGFLPVIVDTTDNQFDYTANDGGGAWSIPAVDGGPATNTSGIAGSPFVDGPFTGFNPNFDIASMTFASQDAAGSIARLDLGPVPAVPVPAAVWLFGSGLLGLVGVARRKKSNV